MSDAAAVPNDDYLKAFMADHGVVLKMRNYLLDKYRGDYAKELVIFDRVAQIERLLVNLDKDL